jgi:hypothetical protein
MGLLVLSVVFLLTARPSLGFQAVVFRADLALEANFGFNVNVRVLKQLAALEQALVLLTALTDGSALGKLKDLRDKLADIPNLFLRMDTVRDAFFLGGFY